MRTHYCGRVEETSIGKTVTVAGWAHRRRDHGGVADELCSGRQAVHRDLSGRGAVQLRAARVGGASARDERPCLPGSAAPEVSLG